jgi:hypothetical protein
LAFQRVARIHGDLSGGADVSCVQTLAANDGLCSRGVSLHGAGFIVTPDEARALGLGTIPGLQKHIRPYRNGRDLAARPRDVMVIDLFGLEAEEVRSRFPGVYQRVHDTVKPERDQNRRAVRRDRWWLFGETNPFLRSFLDGQSRFISTPETAKHRWFTFLDASILPDNMLVNMGLQDAFHLGVLSSRFHVAWALALGGRLGIGNDPRYNKTRCFDPFPFPDPNRDQTDRIRSLGEALDSHRRQVLDSCDDATMTGLYNALARLREANSGGDPLTPKEREFHDRALISVLHSIHHDLDAAVADAYGWPADLPDEEILTRLVSLNAVRAAEEAQGSIRWLRPDFQRARAGLAPKQQEIAGIETPAPVAPVIPKAPPQPWPKDRYEQIKAVRDLVAARPGTYTALEVAGSFKTAQPATVRRHLDMLERIGVLVAYDAGPDRRYHAGAV